MFTRNNVVWLFVAAMAALTLASFAVAGLTVDVASNPSLFVFLVVLGALHIVYRFIRPDARLAAATEIAAQILLILLFGILLSYAAVTARFPYVDAQLYAIDNALGFHRAAYLGFFAQHAWLAAIVSAAYFCMLPQFAAVPLTMFVSGRVDRLRQMILAVALALLITVGISVFTPSLTAFVHVDLPQMLEVPAGLYTPEPTMEALRAGTFRAVELNNLEGLISFPSFHTAAALIFIWTSWPLRYLRWAGLVLNAALISATPIDGAHYIVDVIGGVAVATTAIVASGWLLRKLPDAAVPAPGETATSAPSPLF
jgi:membrane-associated phospholipid phosphatase